MSILSSFSQMIMDYNVLEGTSYTYLEKKGVLISEGFYFACNETTHKPCKYIQMGGVSFR